ncbi:ABC transporter ATP-binding protein [Chitinimonas lacunae]|uniref:ABC transporter ATP-binding protein n=1 Tax=Chitinimonas lacunae TaxID=1963018 RepID=A0ABV8ML48_9NEIS
MNAVLSTQAAALYRHGRVLLEGIDLALPAGSLTALVGPNGAGKTSLLRLLAGLAQPSAGQVLLDGQTLSSYPDRERARRLGWLGQFAPTALPFTLHDYVLLGRRPALGQFGRPDADDLAAVTSAIDDCELTALAERPWARLSGGERQRAGFARLLAQAAPIWLLDEPTNHLDLKHQALLLRRLRQEADRGRTIVAVLHDLPQAARWADQVALLGDGRLLGCGRAAEVLTRERLSAVYGWPLALWRGGDGQWQMAIGEAG